MAFATEISDEGRWVEVRARRGKLPRDGWLLARGHFYFVALVAVFCSRPKFGVFFADWAPVGVVFLPPRALKSGYALF